MTRIKLEVCIDSLGDAQRAKDAGADRLELCAALSEGGLTPSAGLMKAASKLDIPIAAMIRPRAGDFVYSDNDLAIMQDDIAFAQDCGIGTVVFGALSAGGELDLKSLQKLIESAGPMACTLHRAFDFVPEPFAALEQAVDLGFERILTSGQKATALEGLPLICELADRAADRISIMPGAGISAANASALSAIAGIHEIHASCSRPAAAQASVDVGRDSEGSLRRTDGEAVRALRQLLDHAAS